MRKILNNFLLEKIKFFNLIFYLKLIIHFFYYKYVFKTINIFYFIFCCGL